VDDPRWQRFQARKQRFDRNVDVLQRSWVRVEGGARIPASQALRRPELTLAQLEANGDVAIATEPADRLLDMSSVETSIKYEGYLLRQQQAVTRAQGAERRRIPEAFPYERVPGLSREMVQRFSETRPETLGQAQRIPGVTPAAVAVVGAYLGRF
jgi:tRNA uridine 5-carboxymethylaminomethyl modification enzyme